MNNIQQKNALYSLTPDVGLPYEKKQHINNGEQCDSLNATDINNSMQQLLDNDLYVEAQLNAMSSYVEGPKRGDEDTIKTAPDGYKFYGSIETADCLDILRKVETPLSATFTKSKAFGDDEVKFICQFGRATFIGRADKPLMYSFDLDSDQWEALQLTANACCNAGSRMFIAASDGVYQLETRENNEELFSTVKLNKNQLNDVRSICFNAKNKTLAIAAKTSNNSALHMMHGSYNAFADYSDLECSIQFTPKTFYVDEDPTSPGDVNDMQVHQANGAIIAATDDGIAKCLRKAQLINRTKLDDPESGEPLFFKVAKIDSNVYAIGRHGIYKIVDDEILERIACSSENALAESETITAACECDDMIVISTTVQVDATHSKAKLYKMTANGVLTDLLAQSLPQLDTRDKTIECIIKFGKYVMFSIGGSCYEFSTNDDTIVLHQFLQYDHSIHGDASIRHMCTNNSKIVLSDGYLITVVHKTKPIGLDGFITSFSTFQSNGMTFNGNAKYIDVGKNESVYIVEGSTLKCAGASYAARNIANLKTAHCAFANDKEYAVCNCDTSVHVFQAQGTTFVEQTIAIVNSDGTATSFEPDEHIYKIRVGGGVIAMLTRTQQQNGTYKHKLYVSYEDMLPTTVKFTKTSESIQDIATDGEYIYTHNSSNTIDKYVAMPAPMQFDQLSNVVVNSIDYSQALSSLMIATATGGLSVVHGYEFCQKADEEHPALSSSTWVVGANAQTEGQSKRGLFFQSYLGNSLMFNMRDTGIEVMQITDEFNKYGADCISVLAEKDQSTIPTTSIPLDDINSLAFGMLNDVPIVYASSLSRGIMGYTLSVSDFVENSTRSCAYGDSKYISKIVETIDGETTETKSYLSVCSLPDSTLVNGVQLTASILSNLTIQPNASNIVVTNHAMYLTYPDSTSKPMAVYQDMRESFDEDVPPDVDFTSTKVVFKQQEINLACNKILFYNSMKFNPGDDEHDDCVFFVTDNKIYRKNVDRSEAESTDETSEDDEVFVNVFDYTEVWDATAAGVRIVDATIQMAQNPLLLVLTDKNTICSFTVEDNFTLTENFINDGLVFQTPHTSSGEDIAAQQIAFVSEDVVVVRFTDNQTWMYYSDHMTLKCECEKTTKLLQASSRASICECYAVLASTRKLKCLTTNIDIDVQNAAHVWFDNSFDEIAKIIKQTYVVSNQQQQCTFRLNDIVPTFTQVLREFTSKAAWVSAINNKLFYINGNHELRLIYTDGEHDEQEEISYEINVEKCFAHDESGKDTVYAWNNDTVYVSKRKRNYMSTMDANSVCYVLKTNDKNFQTLNFAEENTEIPYYLENSDGTYELTQNVSIYKALLGDDVDDNDAIFTIKHDNDTIYDGLNFFGSGYEFVILATNIFNSQNVRFIDEGHDELYCLSSDGTNYSIIDVNSYDICEADASTTSLYQTNDILVFNDANGLKYTLKTQYGVFSLCALKHQLNAVAQRGSDYLFATPNGVLVAQSYSGKMLDPENKKEYPGVNGHVQSLNSSRNYFDILVSNTNGVTSWQQEYTEEGERTNSLFYRNVDAFTIDENENKLSSWTDKLSVKVDEGWYAGNNATKAFYCYLVQDENDLLAQLQHLHPEVAHNVSCDSSFLEFLNYGVNGRHLLETYNGVKTGKINAFDSIAGVAYMSHDDSIESFTGYNVDECYELDQTARGLECKSLVSDKNLMMYSNTPNWLVKHDGDAAIMAKQLKLNAFSYAAYDDLDQHFVAAQLSSDNKNYVLSSSNGKLWRKAFQLTSNFNYATSIMQLNKNQIAVGTNKGLFISKYQYTTENDVHSFTHQDVMQLFDEAVQQPHGIDSMLASTMQSHIADSHDEKDIVPRLQSDFINVDGEDVVGWQVPVDETPAGLIVKNDIVQEVLFGTYKDGDVVVRTSNFLTPYMTSDPSIELSGITYITKRWMSGVTELYINVPTTHTYYLPNLLGASNCNADPSTALDRKNLAQFGDEAKSQDGVLSEHFTSIEVGIASSDYNIDNLLEMQINGNSLPLKMYKDDTDITPAGQMFKSFIEPSVARDYNVSTTNEDGNYVFKFACFGTDAQAIKLMFYDSKSRMNLPWVKIVFNANGGEGEMPAQKFLIDQETGVLEIKGLKKNKFTNTSSGFTKIFAGWTLSPHPDNYAWESGTADGSQIYEDKKNFPMSTTWEDLAKELMRGTNSHFQKKEQINLYANWLTYQFSNKDTTLVFNSNKQDFYIDQVGVDQSTCLKKNVIVNFGS